MQFIFDNILKHVVHLGDWLWNVEAILSLTAKIWFIKYSYQQMAHDCITVSSKMTHWNTP